MVGEMARHARHDGKKRRGGRFGAGLLPLLLAAGLVGCADDQDTEPPGGCPPEFRGPDGDPRNVPQEIPPSCSFACGAECDEPATPYACPALGSWSSFPHAAACGCFRGVPPEAVVGACTATEPAGEALRKTGEIAPSTWVLPNGHRIEPAGVYAPLDESDLQGTFPLSLTPLPGTSLMLSSDGGVLDNALRLLDVTALVGGQSPSVAHVAFPRPAALYHGVVWLAPDTALASGGDDGMVYAFTVDPAGLSLARDEARDIDLGGPTSQSYGDARWYAGPMAATGDATRLLVGPSTAAQRIQIRSLESASWGESVGQFVISSKSVFEIALDPFDPAGTTFYATLWDGNELVELDADTAEVTRELPLGKNPEGMAFLGAELMVVASADVDRLTLMDRITWQVRGEVDLREPGDPYGLGPSDLAFDAVRNRLYATLSAVNAVAVFDVSLSGGDGILTPLGRIPTAWWPTAVEVQDDGSLVILAGKGTGPGADEGHYTWTEGPIKRLLHGGVQYVDVPQPAGLADWTSTAEQGRRLAVTEGYPEVRCPDETYDFPVPSSPEQGPSEAIEHVIFIVRENKTFDAVFGDLPGVDGDPELVMAPGQMDAIWPNSRALAQAFVNFDNFYTDAAQSLQGHIWTAFGTTTDFIERTWLSSWGRSTRDPLAGIAPVGKPEEGSLFDALDRAGVTYANMGEPVGIGEGGLDPSFPGFVTTIGYPDVEKSCYLAARARATCDLPAVTYVVLPNDHTFGGQAGAAHPGVMIAVNDEATGAVVDALSHSPLWPRSLVIVTEDDPQDGADHVDAHRTPLFMASPWVKRGYVSHGHYDMASVHKLILAIVGVPYPNEQIAQAPLPLDAFTSTPDYTPFDYLPRTFDEPCNPPHTKAAAAAEGWDFDEVDDQPGIAYWLWRILHERRFD